MLITRNLADADKCQDDMTQPIDFEAVADFNLFFYTLTAAVADVAAKTALTN